MEHDEAIWSELLKELLKDIVGRLACFIDYVRFGAVCRSWQSVTVDMHDRLPSSLDPWLMLPQREDNSIIRDFYILSRKEVFELKLPETYAKRCVGSTKGWLVMVDAGLSIHLFNPCTRVQFNLPHQMTFQDEENYSSQGLTKEELRDAFITKVVLSTHPSDPNCIAMAIYSDWNKLAIARPNQDETWTTIPGKWSAYVDVIYYKENFYAINWEGTIVCCDVGGAYMKTTLLTTPLIQSYGQKYLVECSGELLQVIREIELLQVVREIEFEEEDDDYSCVYKTVGFSVFKIDFSDKLWDEMKSLGDYSLFLGYNTSFSWYCNDFPATGVKRDCIYFTDDYKEAHPGYRRRSKTSIGNDNGVFHLEDGHIEPHYTGNGYHPFVSSIWFTPNK